MDPQPLVTAEEVGLKRAFRWAVDWPGWCRGGRTPEAALEAFMAAAGRYAVVAEEAGLAFIPAASAAELALVETTPGDGATEFGVPHVIAPFDRRPTGPAEAERLVRLTGASWAVFDRVAGGAPAELRKGPRGGGRERDAIVAHVVSADHAYAHEMGLRGPEPSAADRAAVEAERAAMLEVLGRPSDGSPLAGRKWTARYAARRIAWHALDHAWEIEDRSEPR